MLKHSVESLTHSIPKIITFCLFLSNIPSQCENIIPFLFSSTTLCLIFHHYDSNKIQVSLSIKDKIVISTNIVVTYLSAFLFIERVKENLIVPYDYHFYADQFMTVVRWILAEEFLFYHMHRLFHTKLFYNNPLVGHKMHHKFKITSAWTSFYAHPVDNFLSVVGITLLTPYVQIMYLNHRIQLQTLVFFMFSGIVTFISSHHVVETRQRSTDGTDHLQHHKFFNCNFGNFGVFDKLYNTYKKQR